MEDVTGVVMITVAPVVITIAGVMTTVLGEGMIAGAMTTVPGVTTVIGTLGLALVLRLGIGMTVVGLVLVVRMIGTAPLRLIGGIVVVLGGMMIGVMEAVEIVLEVVGTVLGDMEKREGRRLPFAKWEIQRVK